MAVRDQSGYLRGDAINGAQLGPLIVAGSNGAPAASNTTLEQIRDDVNDRHQRFDYYVPAGVTTYEVRYIGSAPQGTATTSPWTVRRLSHSAFGGEARVTEIQTLTGAWDNRDTLPWT